MSASKMPCYRQFYEVLERVVMPSHDMLSDQTFLEMLDEVMMPCPSD